MASDDEKELPVGHVLGDRWRVDRRIGEGGTATVYAATHRNGYKVALKVLHARLASNTDIRARFLREGYMANGIEHPGVTRVLDDGATSDGCPFLVVELLDGESLESRAARQGGKIPLAELLTIVDRVLDILSAAHERGIVHRDIKPENVFLTIDGTVKILDFGLARPSIALDMNVGSTQRGLIIGTPDYMAPEQAMGDSTLVGPASDVFSVGATFFALVSGQAVHSAPTVADQLRLLCTQAPRSLATAAPEVPPSIVSVIDRALALAPVDRWPSAKDMRAALRLASSELELPARIHAASVLPGSMAKTSSAPTLIEPTPEDSARLSAASEDIAMALRRPPPQGRKPWVTIALVLAAAGILALLAVASQPRPKPPHKIDQAEELERARRVLGAH